MKNNFYADTLIVSSSRHLGEGSLQRRRDIINMASIISAISTFAYLIICACVSVRDFLPLIVPLAVFSLALAATPLVRRFGERAHGYYLMIIVAIGDTVLDLVAGSDLSAHYFFLATPPVIVMSMGPARRVEAAIAAFAFLSLFLVCQMYIPERTPFVPLSDTMAALSLIFCVISAGSILYTIAIYAFHRIEVAERALDAEYSRSEALLSNLVPNSIADRLKQHPDQIIADQFEAVTVLFADIVDFTPRASRLPAEEIVRFLNRIFSEFDRIAEKHGLEKIKTVGDAYMVAGGLPVGRPDHQSAVANMALDILAAIQVLSLEMGEDITIRIGIDTGPAIAGVIGTRKLFYDVWGDTVNTASRMESLGSAGRIQVTRATVDILADEFVFEPRGLVHVKGKGQMELFYLTGRQPAVGQ